MNEHFIRFIFNEDQGDAFLKVFAGAMASTVNESLNESNDGEIMFESYTTEGMHVYESVNMLLYDVCVCVCMCMCM